VCVCMCVCMCVLPRVCNSLSSLHVYTDLNYLEETSGGPDLTVATLPKSGKIVLLQVW